MSRKLKIKTRKRFPGELILEDEDRNVSLLEPTKDFNPKYVIARNKLIPEALRYADRECFYQKTDEEKALWNLSFHSKMNELAKLL